MTDAMMAMIHARTKNDRNKRILTKLKILSQFKKEGVRHLDTKGREAREELERHQLAILEASLVTLHHKGEFWYANAEGKTAAEQEEDDATKKTRSDTMNSEAAARAASMIALGLSPDDDQGTHQNVPQERNMAIAFLAQYPLRLSAAFMPLRCDKEVVLVAVNADWRSIAFASEELQNDVEVMETAVSLDWHALQFAGDVPRNNLSIIMLAVQQDGQALLHAGEAGRAHYEICLIAVSDEGDALQHVSEDLRSDRTIVAAAMAEDPWSLNYADEKFKDDYDLVFQAVQQKGWVIAVASDRLKDHRELVMEALRHHGGALQFASERLRDDKEVVLLACEESHKAAKHASARLLEDLNVIAASQPPEKESRGRSMGRSIEQQRRKWGSVGGGRVGIGVSLWCSVVFGTANDVGGTGTGTVYAGTV